MGLQLPHRRFDRQNWFVIPNRDSGDHLSTKPTAWAWSVCIHLVIILLLIFFGSFFRVGARQAGSSLLRPAQIVLVNAEDFAFEPKFELNDANQDDSMGIEAISMNEFSLDFGQLDSNVFAAQSNREGDQLETDNRSLPNAGAILDPSQYDASRALSGNAMNGSARPSRAAEIDPQRLAEEQKLVASRAPQGEPISIDFMGLKSLNGRSFIFLIDRSQSMHGEGVDLIRETREHLREAIGTLQPAHRFQIAFFNDRVTTLSVPRLIHATDENKARIEAFLHQMTSVGGTNYVGAIFSALAFQPDVIVLLSDGGDPPLIPQQLKSIQNANQRPSQIHCLHFGVAINPPNPAENFLLQLATENHGSYRYIQAGK